SNHSYRSGLSLIHSIIHRITHRITFVTTVISMVMTSMLYNCRVIRAVRILPMFIPWSHLIKIPSLNVKCTLRGEGKMLLLSLWFKIAFFDNVLKPTLLEYLNLSFHRLEYLNCVRLTFRLESLNYVRLAFRLVSHRLAFSVNRFTYVGVCAWCM
ncbi:hypothetical protein L9F63_015159, partial [Diploptera punctata]